MSPCQLRRSGFTEERRLKCLLLWKPTSAREDLGAEPEWALLGWLAALLREGSSVRDVCLNQGWTHWSPRQVGIPEIPPRCLAARVPSGWCEMELEYVAAAGGDCQDAKRLLLASTSLSSSPCLLPSTWDLCNFISGSPSCFNVEKMKSVWL